MSEPLATIEQYRITFNRYTMVVNYHFIREGVSCHTTFGCMKNDIQTQLKLQFQKVQSSIEKFHWSKKLGKTKKIPFDSVNLFLHVFLCLKVILTMEHYTLTIFI